MLASLECSLERGFVFVSLAYRFIASTQRISMKLAPARTSLALLTVVLMSKITLGFTELPSVAPTSGPDQSLKTLLDDSPRNIEGEAVSHNLPAAISCNALKGIRRTMARSNVIFRAVRKRDVRIVAGFRDQGDASTSRRSPPVSPITSGTPASITLMTAPMA